jgi:hypothetical protein
MKALKLLAVIAVCVSSCTAYKAARQEKKNSKLFAAAISNKIVSDQLDYYYSLQHPMGKPVLIQGKDSIIYTPVYIDRVKDSLIKIDCPSIDLDSLRKASQSTVIRVRVDTLFTPDTSSVFQLQILKANNASLQGKFDQQKEQSAVVKKDFSKWKLWSIVSGFFLLAVIGFLIYLLFRK